MEIGHGTSSSTNNKKKIIGNNDYIVKTLANEHSTKSTSFSNSNASSSCSLCRGSGCSNCMQNNKKQQQQQVMSGLTTNDVEFNTPSLKKDTTELREIKVESPNSPTSPQIIGSSSSTSANNNSNNQHGFPPDILPVSKSQIIVDVESGTKTAIKKGTRKWKYFSGKNRFYCGGRLISAPNISFCLCCFLLIVVTFMLFIIFDGPYLSEKWSIAVPISGVLMFLIVIVSMLKTTFSDPGIIPRASQQEAEYIERCYATNNVGRPPPRTKDVIVNGQTLKVKYCFTCKMFRPPRASHCGVCDNCVDRFDHHCPFLGNCIGKRNYRHFYSFVLSLSFLCVFVLSCATAHLVLISKEKGNFLEALKDSPTSAVVVVISFFGMWTVLGLAGFHTYLISVEQTTNEDIKGLFGKSAIKNPFSRGNIFQNCAFILCGPRQPSLIDSRGLVTEEFLLALPRKNDANGTANSTICNRNSLHMQTSLKTGPQCVEAANRPGISKVQNHQQQQQQQQPFGSGGATYSTSSQSFSQISPSGQQPPPPPTQVVAEGITLSRQSPDSGSGLLYTSAGSNRSLSNMNSGSMRNLYNATIEEDLATISADSGSESNLSHDQHYCSTTSTNNRAEEAVGPLKPARRNDTKQSYSSSYDDESQITNKDDFDDPTMLHQVSPPPPPPSASSLTSQQQQYSFGFGYIPAVETGLDLDDPVSAAGLRRINSNNTSSVNSTSTKRSAATAQQRGRDDSAISLPSTSTSGGGGPSSSNGGKKKSSSVQSLRSQVSLDGSKNNPITNNSKNSKRNQQQQSLINNNGGGGGGGALLNQSTSSTTSSSSALKTARNGIPSSSTTSGSGGGSSSNNSRISSRKLSKSTMIDSPLHLDPIT